MRLRSWWCARRGQRIKAHTDALSLNGVESTIQRSDGRESDGGNQSKQPSNIVPPPPPLAARMSHRSSPPRRSLAASRHLRAQRDFTAQFFNQHC